ncbi:nucleotide exchange factor GrpE, partial [bacterium]|nr:nucleotide exchange factor GrpE [bacterium]
VKHFLDLDRFDPERQIAIGRAQGPEGMVVATLQRGWLCQDRVVRPAEVTVGSGSEA